ncbi:hypothetical protein SEUCBS140593_006041 [Sporothrix eucalyptigena]|uniref:Major facilitator superfamily (MFS) profile domain-containing protein n=1 Tax=Sporothrix eucalyptigena TaxID=1812306 RepID=A0ABP0C1K4_9PEZI
MSTENSTSNRVVSALANSDEECDHSLTLEETNAEILRRSWSRRALIIAFFGLFAATFILSFIKYSTKVYTAYATSDFKGHSELTTANVVYTIMNMATFPILAQLSNVFGRAEAFVIAVLFLTLSMVLYAASQNIATYIASGIFDSIGDTGFTIMQQVFVADTTNLLNRGLWSSLPEAIGAIPTLYLGTIVADSVLEHSTWRWGYGMWAIAMPFCAAPLIMSVFWLQRRAKKNGYHNPRAWGSLPKTEPLWKHLIELVWFDLDIAGCILLVVGLALALVPLTLTGTSASERWHNTSYIAMFVVGIVIIGLFVLWDAFVARKPFVPFRMIRHRTVVAACLLSMLDFFHYSCFSLLFPSFLQVAGHYSAGHASRIDNSLRVSFQVASIFVGLFMKYTRRSKPFIFIGVPLMILGQGLQIYFVSMPGGYVANEASVVTAKVLVGVGRGFYQTAVQVSIQAVVSKEDVAVVTGVFFAAMNFGASIGTSVGGAIWNGVLPGRLTEYLPADGKAQAQAIFKSIVVAQKYAVGSPMRLAIDHAYRDTMRYIAIASTAGLAPMIFIIFAIKNVDLGKSQPGSAEVEAFERVVHEKHAANLEDLQTKKIAHTEPVHETSTEAVLSK